MFVIVRGPGPLAPFVKEGSFTWPVEWTGDLQQAQKYSKIEDAKEALAQLPAALECHIVPVQRLHVRVDV